MPATTWRPCRCATSIQARQVGPPGISSARANASSRDSKTYPELQSSGRTISPAPWPAASSMRLSIRRTFRSFSPTMGSIWTQAIFTAASSRVFRLLMRVSGVAVLFWRYDSMSGPPARRGVGRAPPPGKSRTGHTAFQGGHVTRCGASARQESGARKPWYTPATSTTRPCHRLCELEDQAGVLPKPPALRTRGSSWGSAHHAPRTGTGSGPGGMPREIDTRVPEVRAAAGAARPGRARTQRWPGTLVVSLVLAAALWASPLILGEYAQQILSQAFSFATPAITVDLLWGYTGVLTFGQSAFFGIGVYTVALALAYYVEGLLATAGAILVAMAFAALVGTAVGWLAFFDRASPIYAAIVTLALPVVFTQIILSGGAYTGSSSGLPIPAPFLSITQWYYIAGGLLLLVAIGAYVFVSS